MDAEYIFIVNPSSGGGKGEEVARLLNRMLPDHPAFCDGKGQVFFANHVDAGMLRDTLADARAVVAVGGDGTAHHLIPYLLSCATPPVLGLIPLGTSNDLARALGVPMDKDYTDERILRKTLDELLGAEATNLDVLSVNEEVFFTNYFSIGLDAIIVRDFDDVRKSSWAKLLPAGKITNNFLYFLMGLKNAGFFIQPPIEIEFRDGQESHRIEIDSRRRAIIISNLPVYAGGCHISRDARKDDGLFEITVVQSAWEYLRLIASRFLPFLHLPRGLVQFRARQATLRLSSATPAQVDGEKCADFEKAAASLQISFHSSLPVLAAQSARGLPSDEWRVKLSEQDDSQKPSSSDCPVAGESM